MAILGMAEEDGDRIQVPYPGDVPVWALSSVCAESASSINRKDRGLTHSLNMVRRGDIDSAHWWRERAVSVS
jgi:hypothetical protein